MAVKVIKESEISKKFTDEDWDQFENTYMYGSGKLTDVEFTNSDIEIGDGAFSGCPIKELNLPDGIKNSGGTASFAGTDISKLSLPNSVTRIAYENFANCSNLSEIDIPTSVISMGGHAFDNTPWYDVQADGEVYLEHVFYNYKGEMPAKLQSVTGITNEEVIEACKKAALKTNFNYNSDIGYDTKQSGTITYTFSAK